MADAGQESAKSFLRQWAAVYEALVAHVLHLEPRGDDERTLKWVGVAATLAWRAHPGRYADERLEAVALRAGQRLASADRSPAAQTAAQPRSPDGRRRVLHVASTVYEVGGHTRLIESWMQNDGESRHSLVLLHQRGERIRNDLAGRIAGSGGDLITLPEHCSLLDKARQLRQAARSGFDCVVLHTHPNDVVPLVALASADCPPVALMNHADHAFWLGVSVADVVIDFRDFGARLSRERRGARQSYMMALPIDLTPTPDREAARAFLSIPDDEVVLLSIGAPYKYAPTEKYNFFRTLRRVLTDNPTARLYLIGVGAADVALFGAQGHERMELLGPLSDPNPHEAAADLYLEGFPYGSYTAFFETVARGVCPVLLYAPTPHTDISGDLGLKGLITSPADEEDYIARVTALIENPAARREIGQTAARQVVSTHGSEGSRTYLKNLYDRLAGVKHQAVPPPPRASLEMEEDLNLARVNGAGMTTATLNQIAYAALTPVSARDWMRLFGMSLRLGDTRLAASHIRGWLGLLRHLIFAPRADPEPRA